MTLAAIEAAALAEGLRLRGALHPDADAGAPEGCRTLLLFGPDEPEFWARFKASPEYADPAPHPLDRWSKRVLTGLAAAWGGQAIFPYDGPPYAPFLRWATASGACWSSPVGLLVHEAAGLLISYRGAVALPEPLELPEAGPRPCDACTAPCETACPVGAMGRNQAYDVAACRAHVSSEAGRACRERGCLVRRACPVSETMGRAPEQAAFHMAAFLGRDGR
ncbi:MAG: ferredoxin [Paracoccaceae bacterium]|nr:ferredoxin [Paracoccaceae bacterium]